MNHSMSYHLFNHVIIIHVDGQTHTISKDDKRFKPIETLIKTNALDVIGRVINPKADYYTVVDRIIASITGDET